MGALRPVAATNERLSVIAASVRPAVAMANAGDQAVRANAACRCVSRQVAAKLPVIMPASIRATSPRSSRVGTGAAPRGAHEDFIDSPFLRRIYARLPR